MSSNIKLTEFNEFNKLILDQLEYGGKKYAHSAEREATDVLFETFGHTWLLGTMMKYIFRWKTVKRERDPLKIGAFCYIAWLKRGFFEGGPGTEKVNDTNIELKKKYFPMFYDNALRHYKILMTNNKLPYDPVEWIRYILETAAHKPFKELGQYELLNIFVYSFLLWEKHFSTNAGKDIDTWLEKSEKTR